MVKKLEDAETQAAVKAAMTDYEKLIIGDDQRKAQECMQEIQKILEKYNCVIVPRCMLSPQGMEFMLETIPKPKQPSTPLPGAPNAPKVGAVSP